MGAPKKKTYKRSWRNLLLNKRYQLRFTLFMVGLSALLMALLGWWVMEVAQAATTVAENNVLGDEVCHDPSADVAAAGEDSAAPAAPKADSAAPAADEGAPASDKAAGENAAPASDKAAGENAAPASDKAAAGDHTRPVVTIEESDMQMVGPPPAASTAAATATAQAESRAAYEQCKRDQAVKLLEIESRQELIFWVLIAVGGLLCLGLLMYGIKMTHRVAGPLHKVGLYLTKLKDGEEGHYEPVYNLRKGDRLVDFYEHFKHGYAGVRSMQEEDVTRLKALLAAADEAQLAGRSPELAAALADLRALLEEKEKSLA